jgi:hypothetical protein
LQTLELYVSDRAAAALRRARTKNVLLERLVDREVSAMVFNDEQKACWPLELRRRIEAWRTP